MFPANAVANPVTLTFRELGAPSRPLPRGFTALASFVLEARDDNGQLVTQFLQPYVIVLTYTDTQLAARRVSQDNLNLAWWSGSAWRAMLPCVGCGVDTANRRVMVEGNQLSEFALLSGVPTMHLPNVVK